ncbi:MAG: hypothetical protein A3G33_01635 [Omnitrophica bacterium RIFCSPLOWO2_12_FULL_44_17]|uniref:Type-4 uracil-DNA glycosylase n=1 Tax=Candidatus Danuiimicrobium aquiferis TaxID=1801832 RepID=A0A1G1KV58_9BACT|nr:MAG: hypothetical protein A3B72_00870 [Omnitrophica bacterium RIFCSPHIGHO2_02_FULL_45_28]OGW96816.1 MAG: hypothetical protein A3G33_01635 [Omnitrophica bacterium RIFCSPLOWO2_12_FULL_44_17]OGX03818.1 MAG: hypothetical protein A3J12_09525 [Omnitrophica bacterium RIFCSPLOWO2_02_FULL_44_11]
MQRDLFYDLQNEVLEAASYCEFKAALSSSNCTLCPLAASRSQIVVDRGNPEADVVMIGEAPGEKEDIQGKAFVGRSGQLLDQMMKTVGFDTDRESLIMNVVKCRPPDNRAPKSEEVDACHGFFEKQISLLHPRIILLLGATALKHVIKDKDKRDFSMKNQVGRFFENGRFPGTKIMVLYHPAYILRDPRKKPEMMEHLKTFKKYWNSIR